MAGFFGKLFGGWRGDSRDGLVLRLLAESLNEISGGWTVARGAVHGPGALAIVIERQHDGSDAHLCIGFFLDRDRADGPIIQDCVAGIGGDPETKLRSAVKIWMTGSAPVLLELIEQSGRFADHYLGDDPGGFAGWHAIHGPIFGYGTGSAKEALQTWALEHQLLPQLRESIEPYLDRTSPNGVKLYFGGSPESRIAELRLDGVELPEASEALASLAWPQPSEHAYMRVFIVLVHEEAAEEDEPAYDETTVGSTA